MPSCFGGDVALRFRRATKLPSCGVRQLNRRQRRAQGGGDGGPTDAGKRRMARGRPSRPSAVPPLHPPVRARRRHDARRCRSSPTRRGAKLDADHSNAILLCHAWTGDSHAVGPMGHGHPGAGWWEGAVGPGMAIDTDRWFVVCANVLGGCQGSTGPASPHPIDGKPYGSRFPVVTIRDMVRAQYRLADHLQIPAWHSVVGGSMGGMQVLEWAITFPHRVRSIVPIATCAQATAQQIAWGAIGRRAIRMDPNWRGGDYYDADDDDGPWEGLVRRAHGRPGHVPQRQRVHRSLRSRARRWRDVARQLGSVAAVRGRALPRSSRREAGASFRCQQLPHHRQGDGPARRGPRPRRARSGDGPHPSADAHHRHLQRHLVPVVSTASDSRRVGGRRHSVRVRRDRLTARPRRVPDQPRSAVGSARRLRRCGADGSRTRAATSSSAARRRGSRQRGSSPASSAPFAASRPPIECATRRLRALVEVRGLCPRLPTC